MGRSRLRAFAICFAAGVGLVNVLWTAVRAQREQYRIETAAERTASLEERFTASQIALLEKLNRADVANMEQLQQIVMPQAWDNDELSSRGRRVLTPGTPVFIIGSYDFDAPPPWHSLAWLSSTVELPPAPTTTDMSGPRP